MEIFGISIRKHPTLCTPIVTSEIRHPDLLEIVWCKSFITVVDGVVVKFLAYDVVDVRDLEVQIGADKIYSRWETGAYTEIERYYWLLHDTH